MPYMTLYQTLGQCSNSTSRRRYLAACGVGLFGSTAGCTTIVDSLADLALGDVNLFNETEDVLTGTVTITGPGDESVLSESFELPPESDDDDTDENNDEDGVTAYEDVWTEPGTYEASVELDSESEVQGESTASESISIDNTSEEMLAIAFGMEEVDDAIGFIVGESLSDFAQA
ncbi:hypothetical protein SAMN05192561_105126 [Halopenitus malekzadehii]|uniref:Uncharacterized protein n=2 Tax=Halopenitus malekzadehii TaxID=1267564 RepID=A0A1H6J3E8_9EURY|nr:hypothetical protein SAMN05192561_105126 [Halopenitus malekzadehii]